MDSEISTSFWLDQLCLRFNTFCSGLDDSVPQDPIEFLRDKFHTTCEGLKKLCMYEPAIEEDEEENTEHEPDIQDDEEENTDLAMKINNFVSKEEGNKEDNKEEEEEAKEDEEENTDLEMKINNFVSEEEGNKEEEEAKEDEEENTDFAMKINNCASEEEGNKEEEEEEAKDSEGNKEEDNNKDFKGPIADKVICDSYSDFSTSVGLLMSESNTDADADFSDSVTSFIGESSENTDSDADLSTSIGSLIGESSANTDSWADFSISVTSLIGESSENKFSPEAAVDYVTKTNAIIQLIENQKILQEILDKSEHQKTRDGSQDLSESLVIVDESCLFTDLQDKKKEGKKKLAEKPSLSSSSGVVEATEEDWEIVSLDEGS